LARFLADAQIEARASALWRRHGLSVGFDVEQLLDALDLGTLWEDELEPDVLGLLIPSQRLVVIHEGRRADFERNLGLYRFTVSHEVGHWLLHCEDARANNMQLIDGDRTWCRQGSREPIEVQAEKFASYLLAPTDELKAWVPRHSWKGWPTVYALASTFGMSASAMIVRLQEAKLAYRDDTGLPRSGRPTPAGQLELGLGARDDTTGLRDDG
jgi:hypothetical protein